MNALPTTNLAEAIASHRFLKGMTAEHLDLLTKSAMFKEFDPGQLIFGEGEPANRFYLIGSGKVAIESRRNAQTPLTIQRVGEGEALGWSWLFPPYYWHFDARAIEPTSAIFFYGTRLRAECEENPVFGYELLSRMAAVAVQRLQRARAQLVGAQIPGD